MDLIRLSIPYTFLSEHIHLTWQSLRSGVDLGSMPLAQLIERMKGECIARKDTASDQSTATAA